MLGSKSHTPKRINEQVQHSCWSVVRAWRSSRLPATDAPHKRQGVLRDQQRFSAVSSDDAHLHGPRKVGHPDSGSAHSGAQLPNGPSIVRCSAATDELLTTFIERFFLQHLQPRRVGQGSENSSAVQSEECTASQSGIPVRQTDSRHRMQRLRRGSRVAAGCRVCVGGRSCA